jgi:DNA replication initiation complex subunit (GINS family)
VFAFGGCTGFQPNRMPFWTGLREQGKRIEKLSRIEQDLIKEVHPQVNEIKAEMKKMIAAVKENSENNPPAAQKKAR